MDTDLSRTYIRASSAVLKTFSPVFAALLGPNYKEGGRLESQSQMEIPIPDDDPEALIMLLNILHMRNDQVPDVLDCHRMVDVVNLADKYLCKDKMELAARLWIKNVEDTTVIAEIGPLITACCLLDFDRYFEYFTRRLVMHGTGRDSLQDDTVNYGTTRDDLRYMFGKLN